MRNRVSKLFAIFTFMIISVSALAIGCGGSDNSNPTGGILRQPINLPTQGGLDGQNFLTFIYRSTAYGIYDNLVRLTTDGEIVPNLAKSWEISNGGKTVTFELEKGVKFHDGSDYNADVAVWVMNRLVNESKFKGDMGGMVDRSEAKDGKLIVHLKKPNRGFLGNLSIQAGHTVSQAQIEKVGEDDYDASPTGTGPFRLKEFTPGIRIELERNTDYWEDNVPNLDGIIITGIPDETVQLAMIRSGEGDLMTYMSPNDLELVKDDPNLHVIGGGGTTRVIVMNNKIGPFAENKALRQAVAYALDRKAIIDVNWSGHGNPAYIPIIEEDWAHDSTFKPYEKNIETAKAKMAEAGYNDEELPLYCMSSAVEIRLCEVIQASLLQADLNVTIKRVIPGEYWSTWYKAYAGEGGDRSTFGYWWWSWRPDPDITLTRAFRSDGSWNVADYNSPEADRLLDAGRAEYDVAKAQAIYADLYKVIMDDLPIAPFAFPKDYNVMSKKVKGLNWRPDPGVRYREIWMEQ